MNHPHYYNEWEPYAAEWLRNLIKAGHLPAGDVDERSIADVAPDDLIGYTQCHFFAGIGGWALAARMAGWPIDRELWTGSCPCQPFSVAGSNKEVSDDRHLWPVWFRLIAERRPAAVFGEQVDGAINHGWLDLVQSDLEGEGYAFAPVGIPAASVGAPHKRHRLWFVADTEWNKQPGQKPRRGETRRMGARGELLAWDGGWQTALARFRAMGDGVPRRVAATDAARNAIVPQVAAEVIAAYMECCP